MNLEINIENIFEIYKEKIGNLEHEIVILTAKCSQLEKMLKEKEKLLEKQN